MPKAATDIVMAATEAVRVRLKIFIVSSRMKHAFKDAFVARFALLFIGSDFVLSKALQISGMLSTSFCIPEMSIAVPQMRFQGLLPIRPFLDVFLLQCGMKTTRSSI
tara:strand:- start:89349 stop:89669 length:321 start_codon:yes stop_codon:yes gene_type:complete